MLIPDNINDFDSDGERMLYLKFKNDGSTDNMYVMHSVFTNHHINNMSGELDFLVLAPNMGFFSIEVKHGGISRKNGEWCFTNRKNKTNCKKTGPFVQQSKTMNSIRKYVLKKIKHKKEMHERFKKILWGSGVAFTSMDSFTDFGPEGHAYQVLNRNGLLRLPIGKYIETLSVGSHKEHSGKGLYDPNQARPTQKDCENLMNILRGDFDIDYSDVNKINDTEALIKEYTKEQFKLLDFINYNPRCLIEGGAGTGKTLMALELSKRFTDQSLKVGLFCFNTLLGEKLQHLFQKFEKGSDSLNYSGTMHKYLVKETDSNPPSDLKEHPKYYSETLPLEFLIKYEERTEQEKFDVLILDECQDLLSPFYIEVFDTILKNGLKKGKWIMFGDFSNQAIYLNKPEEIFERLSAITTYTRFPPLSINCRNTKQIARQNTWLTGVEMPIYSSRINDGRIVTSKYPTRSSRIAAVEKILSELDGREIPFDKVTLLSPKRLENSYINESEMIETFLKKGMTYSTVQAYKGLENSIVVLFDFDEITSEKMQRLLYVGISRARLELYIVLDKSLTETVRKLIEKNS